MGLCKLLKDAGCREQTLSSCRRGGTCPSMAKLVASDECLPRAQRMPHGGASTMMEKAGLVSINNSLGKLNYGNLSPARLMLKLHSLHRFHADPQNTSSRNTATREVPRNFNVNLPRLTSEHALFSSDPVTGTLQLRSFRSYCRSARHITEHLPCASTVLLLLPLNHLPRYRVCA